MPVAMPVKPIPDLSALLAGYAVNGRAEVFDFLAPRPHLETILRDAPRWLERAFGRSLPLRLSIFRDHEEPSSAELIVEIVTGRTGEAAWQESDRCLRALHEQWLSALPRSAMRDILFVAEPE